MGHETAQYTKEEAHLLPQPNCPHCGLPLDWGKSGQYIHVKWFMERGECGSEWCPDFPPEHGFRNRSKACESIVAAHQERDRLREELESVRSVFGELDAALEKAWKERILPAAAIPGDLVRRCKAALTPTQEAKP